LGSLWGDALAGSGCISCLVGGAISVKRVLVACDPAQVAVEYGVAAGGLLVATWCCAFMVKVVVGATAVSTPWCLVAGHAYISRVAEFEAVFAH